MTKVRILATVAIVFGVLVGYFVYNSEIKEDSSHKFAYGLDLDGGTHITFRIDTSTLASEDIDDSLNALRRTIERRVNVFGVSEPLVQIEEGGLGSDELDKYRLIVELPGVTDVEEAVKAIGRTPVLEFKLAKENSEEILSQINASSTPEEITALINEAYEATGLGGAQLKRAQLVFSQTSGQPIVQVDFNNDGAELFHKITKEHTGEVLGIFLDGLAISAPVITQEIPGGTAEISGGFTPDEAKSLAQDLNLGALPVPIEQIESNTIAPLLGAETKAAGTLALVYAFLAICIFLIIWYRLPGIIATISLLVYGVVVLALFKLIPVVITASGVAGFILSLGMAVDANILIFERMKEELKNGKSLRDALDDGFKRAWPSIRDGNISSIISAVILYWLSGTAVVQGFALVLLIGILVSMFSAITYSRILIALFAKEKYSELYKKLFLTGFSK